MGIINDSMMTSINLAAMIEFKPGLSCPWTARTLRVGLHLLEKYPTDVVILDVLLPDGDEAPVIRDILSHAPDSTVVVLTTSPEAVHELVAHRSGAVFVQKQAGLAHVFTALRGLL